MSGCRSAFHGNPERGINTPLQETDCCRLLGCVGSIGFLGNVEVCRADFAVVGGGVVLGEVIAKVGGAWTPVHEEMALANTILDPVEAHVHCFGFALTDSSVGDARGSRIVSLNRRGRLGMSHFGEGCA